jgi:hypothetical protein
MRWGENIFETVADLLRFVGMGAYLVCLGAVGITAAFLTTITCYRLAEWVLKNYLSNPW